MHIKYQGEKLILSEFDCDCGAVHNTPDMDIYIGNSILTKCAQYIDKRNLGKKVVVVTDNIIYDLAGKQVESALETAGYKVTMCQLVRKGELHPNQVALGEILLAMEKDTDFLLALGSGSINDLTRYVSVNTGRPFVSIETAPSMDGYTSVVAPLLNGNLKVNKPATYPKVLICDLDIMKKAPYEMMISGFGDVIGKYIAKADWILGKIINDEQYCPMCVEIVSQAVQKCVDNIEGIKNRTDEGVKSLIEALILAGLTILIIDNTRPVASVEHNMAHYWEMMKLLKNEEPPKHGTAVGVGTIYAVKFFDLFLDMDISLLDDEKIRDERESDDQREKNVIKKYGEIVGPSIIKDNPKELPEWPEQKRRINAAIENMDRIRQELEFMPSTEQVVDMYQRLGCPLTAAEINIDDTLLKDALLYAKDYRSRYTVFKLANELGVLTKIVEKIV